MLRIVLRRAAVLCVVTALMAAGGAAPASGASVRYVDEVFTEVASTKGIHFATVDNYRGDTLELRLDVYEPAGDNLDRRPVLIYAHGGAGIAGSRSEGKGYGEALARRGWVVVSIDYRLYFKYLPPQCNFHDFCKALNPEFHFRIKEAQHDFQAAVRWVRANAEALRIDPEKILGGGFSFGTVLALLANFEPEPPDVQFPNTSNPGVPSHIAGAFADSGGMHETSTIGLNEPPIIGWAYQQDRDGAAALTAIPCLQTQALGNVCDLNLLESGPGELKHGVGPGRAAQKTAEFFCQHAIDCTVPDPAPEGRTVFAKGLTDHDCDPDKWHFAITEMRSADAAPASIQATFSNGETIAVPLDRVSGRNAHYTTDAHLEETVTSARAQVEEDWSGQFNLGSGPCP